MSEKSLIWFNQKFAIDKSVNFPFLLGKFVERFSNYFGAT